MERFKRMCPMRYYIPLSVTIRLVDRCEALLGSRWSGDGNSNGQQRNEIVRPFTNR